MRAAALIVSSALLLAGATVPAQQPLPDQETFLAVVRDNLLSAQRRQFAYAYKERRTELHMNPFGSRLGTRGSRVVDVVPSEDGRSMTRRVIERDGKPVENPEVRRREIDPEDRPQTRERSRFAEVVETLQFKVAGREQVDGRPMILVSFTPRPDAEPRSREGKMARVFSGTIWVDEAAREVARVEAVAGDNLSIGFGLVARLNKGTTASLVRERVADGIWLPTSLRLSGEGRAMLFIRKVDVDFAIDWYDYRKVGSW
jgi:hypothetical protein